jgi:hypothetical protein
VGVLGKGNERTKLVEGEATVPYQNREKEMEAKVKRARDRRDVYRYRSA